MSPALKARQHPTLDEHTVTHGIAKYHAPIYLQKGIDTGNRKDMHPISAFDSRVTPILNL